MRIQVVFIRTRGNVKELSLAAPKGDDEMRLHIDIYDMQMVFSILMVALYLTILGFLVSGYL